MTHERPSASTRVRVVSLTPAQQRAVVVLVATGSTQEAATAAKVTERSVRRWISDRPDFRDAYRDASRTAAAEALSALLSAQSAAVAALRACLTAESPATRVRAARALLEVGQRASADDLDQRLIDVERQVAAWRGDDERTGLTAV